MPPKSFNKPCPYEFLLYKTNKLQLYKINTFVCTVIDHRRRHSVCKEQQSRHSTSSRVVLFCSLHPVTSSVIYYSTHTQKNAIYLLNTVNGRCAEIYFIYGINIILNDKSWALTWASHFPAERTLKEHFRSSTQCFFGV